MSSLYALRGVKFLTTLIVEKRWKKIAKKWGKWKKTKHLVYRNKKVNTAHFKILRM
jgi:hypothetical protein